MPAIKISDRWLQGHILALRRQRPDLDERELLHQAIANWLEQERLAAQHQEEDLPCQPKDS